jgi:hypothetical protein
VSRSCFVSFLLHRLGFSSSIVGSSSGSSSISCCFPSRVWAKVQPLHESWPVTFPRPIANSYGTDRYPKRYPSDIEGVLSGRAPESRSLSIRRGYSGVWFRTLGWGARLAISLASSRAWLPPTVVLRGRAPLCSTLCSCSPSGRALFCCRALPLHNTSKVPLPRGTPLLIFLCCALPPSVLDAFFYRASVATHVCNVSLPRQQPRLSPVLPWHSFVVILCRGTLFVSQYLPRFLSKPSPHSVPFRIF